MMINKVECGPTGQSFVQPGPKALEKATPKDLLAIQEAVTRKIVQELGDFDNLYYEVCNEPYFGGVTMEWQHRIAPVVAYRGVFGWEHETEPIGPERPLLLSPADKERIAYHEGGHTILGLVVPGADPVDRVNNREQT